MYHGGLFRPLLLGDDRQPALLKLAPDPPSSPTHKTGASALGEARFSRLTVEVNKAKEAMNMGLALFCLGLLWGSLFCMKTDPGQALGLGASGVLMGGITGLIRILTNSSAPVRLVGCTSINSDL